MNPEQALGVLAQATEPDAKLSRRDYVLIDRALSVLADYLKNSIPRKDVVVPANEEETVDS